MHVISKKRLKEFWSDHRDAERSLAAWVKITAKAKWESLTEVKKAFPSADLVGQCVVFNIAGNKYRLIVRIQRQRVYIRHIMTHAEYDRGKWKDDCEC
ncbi:MAG: type II toxin-antitoxin system HigB family toxin [Acidobacteriota bacterium]